MLKVNLEKELIRQNKKVLLPEELLSIKEYERLGDDICNNEVLSRIGINSHAVNGKKFKMREKQVSQCLSKFDQSKVFHVSQIKSICIKYHLRFLDASLFKGSIDKELASKISTIEIAHGVRMDSYNCKIVAPSKSFNLEEKPKDPLFFYYLGNDYWYLVHKWGNDLSLFRRAYRLLSNAWVTYFIVMIPLLLSFRYITVTPLSNGNFRIDVVGLVFLIIIFAYTILSVAIASGGNCIRFVKKNEWDSKYFL